MAQRRFDDPILELAVRTAGEDYGPAVIELADVTDAEAETLLEVLDEIEAEEQARGIAAQLRQMGHTL